MHFKYGLQEYIDQPQHPSVLHSDDKFVIVQDKFPKSLRHYLVIPRDPNITLVHPLVALRDEEFRGDVVRAAAVAQDLMVQSLVDEGFVEDSPSGRAEFRNTFIRTGVHAIPSMANLHVHVITQDFHSSRMKHKKHYNSFTTAFFVGLGEFGSESERGQESSSDAESSEASESYHPAENGLMVTAPARSRRERLIRDASLKCTYCGETFGNRFQALKAHLAQEFVGFFRRS